MKPLAVISDVHGNIWALDAVLEDIERRGISHIVNLGDHLWGPLDPAATGNRLMQLHALSIRGNQDRTLIEPASEPPHPTSVFTRSRLTDAHLQWLRSQPATLVHQDVFLCHGTPASDLEYLAESVGMSGVRCGRRRKSLNCCRWWRRRRYSAVTPMCREFCRPRAS